MKISDNLRAHFLERLSELMRDGYDPYNSVGNLKIGKTGISFSWRG